MEHKQTVEEYFNESFNEWHFELLLEWMEKDNPADFQTFVKHVQNNDRASMLLWIEMNGYEMVEYDDPFTVGLKKRGILIGSARWPESDWMDYLFLRCKASSN